jgi:hypothetical protein
MAYGLRVSIALAHADWDCSRLCLSLGGLIPIPHGNLCGKLNAEVMTDVIKGILDDPELNSSINQS